MKPRLALTFETGGDRSATEQNLAVLVDQQIRCTIFLYGGWSVQYSDVIRRMAANGHELGNHTYTHPDLTQCPDEQVLDELQRTDELAQRLTGQRAFPWFRPPFGTMDERVRRIVTGLGYRIVQRNAVDGSHWPGETTPAAILARCVGAAADNAVLTFHLGSTLTRQTLPAVIDALGTAGFAFVSLSELPVVSEYPESKASSEEHSDFIL